MRRAALTSFLCACSALVLAAPAPAQEAAPAPAPEPTPAPARASIEVTGGIRAKGRSWLLTGQTATVSGRVTPFVAGQLVRVRIAAPGRTPTVVQARIHEGRRGGVFRVRFRVRRAVTYRVSARHAGTDGQRAFSASAVAGGVAYGTRRGVGVALFKQGLRALGYRAGYGPGWDDRVARAVMAFRKTNDLGRSFSPTRTVFEMAYSGRGAYRLRYPGAGKHLEADLSRQVLVLADRGKPIATFHTSSGTAETPTILGRYRVYMKQPGTNAKQMYMSSYFIRGYAIHGFPSVPTYPASHGCLRVPNADAVWIFNWIRIGDPIWVYP